MFKNGGLVVLYLLFGSMFSLKKLEYWLLMWSIVMSYILYNSRYPVTYHLQKLLSPSHCTTTSCLQFGFLQDVVIHVPLGYSLNRISNL